MLAGVLRIVQERDLLQPSIALGAFPHRRTLAAVEKDGMFWMAVVDADSGVLGQHLVLSAASIDHTNRWIVHSPTLNFDREAHDISKKRT